MNAALWLLLFGRGTSRTARYIDTDVDPETVLAANERPLCLSVASRPLLFASEREHVFVGAARDLSLSTDRDDLFVGADR